MADISFLLLIFFLVATTMNTDTGLMRMLPPMPPENQQQEEIKVKERNLFLVLISGSGNIMAGASGQAGADRCSRQLKDMDQGVHRQPDGRREPAREGRSARSTWPTAANGPIR